MPWATEAWQRLRERIALKIELLKVGELANLRRERGQLVVIDPQRLELVESADTGTG
jgi:hypothetical protein